MKKPREVHYPEPKQRTKRSTTEDRPEWNAKRTEPHPDDQQLDNMQNIFDNAWARVVPQIGKKRRIEGSLNRSAMTPNSKRLPEGEPAHSVSKTPRHMLQGSSGSQNPTPSTSA